MKIRRVGIAPGVRISGEVFHRDAISAAVAVGRPVKWLVQVAHKVNDESQRVGSLGCGRIFILQDGELGRDRTQHAPARTAEILRRAVCNAYGNVDEVPGGRARIAAALIVGPSGGIHERVQSGLPAIPFQLRIDRVRCQQSKQCLLRLRTGDIDMRFLSSSRCGRLRVIRSMFIQP